MVELEFLLRHSGSVVCPLNHYASQSEHIVKFRIMGGMDVFGLIIVIFLI